MMKINGIQIELNHYPDNTLLLNSLDGVSEFSKLIHISWQFENNEEMIVLYFIVNHVRRIVPNCTLILHMPYIPNARMDRVKTNDNVFTLKYFAEFINSLKFNEVEVLDPHSYVSEALINNIKFYQWHDNIKEIIYKYKLNEENTILFFPDEGAMKRYANLSNKFNIPYAFGIKNRDWKTGEILSLEVHGYIPDIDNYNVLIIDDICSKGGTFYHTAKSLKTYCAGNIYLYVNHCENSIFDGTFGENKVSLLGTGLIEKVFTTNSIYNKSKDFTDKIYAFNIF